MLLCAEEEREYTPIKNKASTKRQKDHYSKTSLCNALYRDTCNALHRYKKM